MSEDSDELRREELGRFLRERRDEIQPEEVGLVRRGRRRVRGLRRHEVADIAGVSVTWYTWLEQAREINVSVSLLDAVARALKLDDEGWRYVRRLAGAPVLEPHPARLEVDLPLRILLDDLMPSPAVLVTPSFEFLAWNRSFTAVWGEPDSGLGSHSGLWDLFMSPVFRERLQNWEQVMPDIVARVRAEYGKNPGDPTFRALIADLSDASDEFRSAFQRPHIARFTQQTQVVDHPEIGRVELQHQLLRPLDRPGLLLFVSLPIDLESRHRLELLEVNRERSVIPHIGGLTPMAG
jgi:transcriptional regulator with XRE-family HTH domain